jgi:hypothetical protein
VQLLLREAVYRAAGLCSYEPQVRTEREGIEGGRASRRRPPGADGRVGDGRHRGGHRRPGGDGLVGDARSRACSCGLTGWARSPAGGGRRVPPPPTRRGPGGAVRSRGRWPRSPLTASASARSPAGGGERRRRRRGGAAVCSPPAPPDGRRPMRRPAPPRRPHPHLPQAPRRAPPDASRVRGARTQCKAPPPTRAASAPRSPPPPRPPGPRPPSRRTPSPSTPPPIHARVCPTPSQRLRPSLADVPPGSLPFSPLPPPPRSGGG